MKTKESIRKYNKDYYHKNKEKRQLYHKKWRLETKEIRRKYEFERSRTLEGRFSGLKASAKHRNISFKITFKIYVKLVKNKNCYYCKGLLPVAGSGLDRVDAKKGYVVSNVVPCCSICNRIKSDKISFKNMIQLKPALILLRQLKEKLKC